MIYQNIFSTTGGESINGRKALRPSQIHFAIANRLFKNDRSHVTLTWSRTERRTKTRSRNCALRRRPRSSITQYRLIIRRSFSSSSRGIKWSEEFCQRVVFYLACTHTHIHKASASIIWMIEFIRPIAEYSVNLIRQLGLFWSGAQRHEAPEGPLF